MWAMLVPVFELEVARTYPSRCPVGVSYRSVVYAELQVIDTLVDVPVEATADKSV
jgi:hypothetical protein